MLLAHEKSTVVRVRMRALGSWGVQGGVGGLEKYREPTFLRHLRERKGEGGGKVTRARERVKCDARERVKCYARESQVLRARESQVRESKEEARG